MHVKLQHMYSLQIALDYNFSGFKDGKSGLLISLDCSSCWKLFNPINNPVTAHLMTETKSMIYL